MGVLGFFLDDINHATDVDRPNTERPRDKGKTGAGFEGCVYAGGPDPSQVKLTPAFERGSSCIPRDLALSKLDALFIVRPAFRKGSFRAADFIIGEPSNASLLYEGVNIGFTGTDQR
jgi:hypothetical protein